MDKRSATDDAIALALARGLTQVEAGEAAGVSDRTVRTRLQDPAFVALVRQLRSRLLDRAVGKLAGQLDRGIDRLGELLDDPDPLIRTRAVKILLDQNVKFGSYNDLAKQVEEIRDSLKTRGNR